MILSEQETSARLDSSENLVNKFARTNSLQVIQKKPLHRAPEIPKFIRNTMSVLAHSGENQTKIANAFGTTHSEVSKCKRGAVPIDEDIVKNTLGEVRDVALEKLMASLGLLSDDKLSECSAKDLSIIASNMGRVVEKTIPQQTPGSNVNLVIYAPQTRREEGYKVIEIG